VEGRWIPRTSAGRRPDGILVVSRLETRGGTPGRVDRLRNWTAGTILEMYGARAGLVEALLVGSRGGIDPVLNAAFQRSGLVHLLSISGFHVGVLALTLLAAIGWLARRFETLLLWGNVRRWSVLAVLPIVIGYLLLTGVGAATVRSVLMLGAVCLALLDEREHDHLDTLILAAVVMLAVSPWLVFDISCQLSFLALLGLILLTPPLKRLLPAVSFPGGEQVLGLVAASLAAILATAPLVAYYFHLFGLTGIVANLFVVPLVGYGAVVVGFAGLLVAPVLPVAAHGIFAVAGGMIDLANRGVMQCALLPVWRGVSPSLAEVFLLIGVVLAFGLRHWRVRCGVIGALLVCGMTLRFLNGQGTVGRLQVFFLSVGQAEATLLCFPSGKTMLVDSGGTPMRDDHHWGERVLVPALWRLGVRKLDYLVLTHPHADHVGGATDLFAMVPVGEVWYGGTADDPAWRPVVAAATRSGIPGRWVDGRTPPLWVDEVRIEPLWPLPRGAGGDANDRSLVFRLGWQRFALLFAGDVGWEVADYLARTRGRQLACTVLKVPHHGSRHSDAPSLYRVAQPRQAVISAGYGNRFGLPAAETLAALHQAGIQVLRTDLDGTLRLVVADDGQPSIMQRHFRHFH
jgi:competence protein ComEC